MIFAYNTISFIHQLKYTNTVTLYTGWLWYCYNNELYYNFNYYFKSRLHSVQPSGTQNM